MDMKRVTFRQKGKAFKTKILATGTTPERVELHRWMELVEQSEGATT